MAKELFTEEQIKYIEQAIGEAEQNTSGEIRVHIEKRCKEDVLDRASHVFSLLEIQKQNSEMGFCFI